MRPLETRFTLGEVFTVYFRHRGPQLSEKWRIDGDFRWLNSAFNWACRHTVQGTGEKLLDKNPLSSLPDRKEWGNNRWPKEKNVRRPVASHQRYVKTMEKTDEVDPMGRLRCMLALARYTGRRENAICRLRASDFLRTKEDVRKMLASLGMDESHADEWEDGGTWPASGCYALRRRRSCRR